MGKRRRLRQKDHNFAEKRRNKALNINQKPEDGPRRSYEAIIRENANFEMFYKSQKICPDEEWDAFMSAIKENLPAAFRITGYRSQAQALLKIVQGQYFKEILSGSSTEPNGEGDTGDKESNIKPICLPWYPDNLAWQLQLTRKDIRRSESYFRLHNFLITETESGNISRQEVVSMIPPLVLKVESHHKILDMCAAPGSKTAQLIELLHADEGKLPEGFVVANDVDNKRCYMLVHQAKRLMSPCIIITNHDSSVMPNFTVTKPDGSKGMLKFDRVLCDVPCSGDGTLRKNPDVWQKWNTANGSNLHGIQFRIVKRGVELLAVGGRLVYSTCSLNPLENEAVMHRLMLETEGAVQLVEVASMLPGLKYRPGLTHWVPTSRDMKGYSSFSEVPEKWHTQLRPTMFPPSTEDAPKFHLDRCIRILPHHQDTGGFFVAVVEKVRTLPWEASPKVQEDSIVKEPESTIPVRTDRSPARKRPRIHGYREDPFLFFSEEEPLWPTIRNFYNIDPQLQPTLLLTRCKEGKKKNIYFTSPAVRDVVRNNEAKIKLINTGVKTFVRCDNKGVTCDFRLAQEGIHSILPFVKSRLINVTREDLIILLTNDDDILPPETISLDPSTQERLKGIETGSCVLIYKEPTETPETGLKIELVGWKGKTSVRAYVPKNERIHYLRLCGGDISKFEFNKFKDKENGEKEAEKADLIETEEEANEDSCGIDDPEESDSKPVEKIESSDSKGDSVTKADSIG